MTQSQPPGVPGPVVPLPGRTTHEQVGDIAGGPISPADWHSASPALQRLMIDGWIAKACQAEGVDPGAWGAPLRTLIKRESGEFTNEPGDPNIVNLYDENAKAGIPSMGFAQVIQPNAPGQSLLDPVANIRASIRHIKETYGDIRKVQQADPNLPKRGYAEGGPVKLHPVQELNFLQWAMSEGMQPTDELRQKWLNPKGFDAGGPVDPPQPDPRFTYPYPFDPSNPPIKQRGIKDWSTEPGGGLDFLGKDTEEKGTQNIMAAARAALNQPWVKAAGETWYRAAYDWVVYMVRATGADLEIDRAIAICAELSRNTDWWTNMMRFRRYLAGDLKIKGDPYAVGQEVYDVVKRLENKRLTPDPMDAISGQKPHNFGWSMKRAGQDVAEPALIKPEEFGDPVAMDRWAKRIAMGVSDLPDVMVTDKKSLFDIVDALQAKGEYPSPTGIGKWTKSFDVMADMFREAARRLGVPLSEVLQALTWVYEGPTKSMQTRTADPTITRFRETFEATGKGEWRFPLTDEDIADLILAEVKENPYGFTFAVTGEKPTTGLAYAPSKETELYLEPGKLSREDIVKYIRAHPEIWLKGRGGHIGGWLENPELDKSLQQLVLDVSKVEPDEAKWASAIREAQKGSQQSLYDLGRDRQLNLGYIDKATGEYIPLGKPKELLQEHLAGKPPRQAPTQVPVPEPESPKPPVQEAKPLPKITRQMPETEIRAPRSGPGATMAPESPSTLGRIGRGLGPALQGLGDVAQAYGIVGQAAQQGQEEELKKGHSIKQEPPELGIPLGEAFPTPKSLVKTTPMTPSDAAGVKPPPAPTPYDVSKIPQDTVDRAAKSGHPIPGTTPSPGILPPPPPSKPNGWWGIQFDSEVIVRHANGSPPTRHRLRQTGPNQYESPNSIPLSPGDEIFLNGRRVR